jgi:hypothetical protein
MKSSEKMTIVAKMKARDGRIGLTRTQERKSSDHAVEASGAPPAYCLRAVFVFPETQHALVDSAVLSVLERGPRAFLPAVYVFFSGSP